MYEQRYVVGSKKRMDDGERAVDSVPLVMLVDDERGLLELFANLIAQLDYEVISVPDGRVALDVLGRVTPDLLILDLGMPEISGYEVLRYVRNVPRLAQMKVVILTARPHLISNIEPLGIDAWHIKPIRPQDFLEMVQTMLSSGRYN